MQTEDNNTGSGLASIFWKMLGFIATIMGISYAATLIIKYTSPYFWITEFSIIGLVILIWSIIIFRKYATNKLKGEYQHRIDELETALEMAKSPILPPTKNTKIRIAVLLPLHDADKIVEQDVELILEGFGNAFSKVRDKMDKFELIFLDHKNKFEIGKKLVENELKNGCQYFICTMSVVCEPLSKVFSELLATENKKAILLCTVAASPNVKTVTNQVYRFFVNAEEEAKFLVDHLKHEGKTASMIHFDTIYSQITSEKFKENWDKVSTDHKCEEGIEIQEKDYGNISRELNLTHNKKKLEGKDIIFVVAYCTAYQDIFLTLKNLGIQSTIVTTSTFSFKKFDDAKKTLLDNFKWVTCYPLKKDGKFYGDAANYFAFASLYRLVTVVFQDGYSIENFDEKWKSIKVPTKLDFIPAEDSKIKLELDTTHKKTTTKPPHKKTHS